MSSATKRKHVTRGVVENFDLPKDDELVVKVRPVHGVLAGL